MVSKLLVLIHFYCGESISMVVETLPRETLRSLSCSAKYQPTCLRAILRFTNIHHKIDETWQHCSSNIATHLHQYWEQHNIWQFAESGKISRNIKDSLGPATVSLTRSA